jgi:Ca2+-binding EF-hand superfamily protein
LSSGGFGPPGGFGSSGGFGPPSGGFGGGSGGFSSRGGDDGAARTSGFFDRLDRNRDGRLDGEEMQAAGPFQGILDRAGIREGASREDFTRSFEKIREESQRGRESGRDDRSRDAGYTPAPRPRITKDLPSAYVDRDSDGDGQLGLYEWREWDRTRMDEFFFFDRNGDGFLTPSELAAIEEANESDGRGRGGDRSDRGGDRGDSDRDRRAPEPPASQAISASGGPPKLDESDPNVVQARKYFALLDGDKNGKASVEELAKLKKLRPLFEQAGIQLDREMSADEFAANYVKVSTN